MRITICDDDKLELERIYTLTQKYIHKRNLHAQITAFQSSASLTEYEKSNAGANIYILDVIMPGTNGIELGGIIHKRRKNAFIIYLTTSKDFAVDAFKVKAFAYLIKPVVEKELFSELDQCFNNITKTDKKFILKTAPNNISVNSSDIITVEYLNHKLIYHTVRGNFESAWLRGKFDDISKEFIDTEEFVKISASHIVNIKHIQSVNADEFIMSDGSGYKITRRYADAKKKYLNRVLS
jgi:DNA-binding LytR/AlgR family response regulator